ncbi:MAG: hypothetical protein JWN32_1755 [Solirubrobacterales bacterium]|nr:hypothetical protein [Solirubrobacterales bacterium]
MIRGMWWGLIGFVIGLLVVMVVLGVIMESGSSSDRSGHH